MGESDASSDGSAERFLAVLGMTAIRPGKLKRSMLRPYKIRGRLLLPRVIYRVRGPRRQSFGIGFQRFHNFGNAAL